MRRFFGFILILTLALNTQAQKHEVGLFLGGANGITDIGRTDYINPLPKEYDGNLVMPIAIGGIYKYNLNPQQGIRLNLSYAKIIDNDRIATEDYRFNRGAQYSQSIFELSAVYEYDFFPINAEQRTGNSPYIFFGLGVFSHRYPQYTITHQFYEGSTDPVADGFETFITKDDENRFNYTIPFGAGYKFKFNYNWIIGAEIGVRVTGIDAIDMADTQPRDYIYVIESGLETFEGITEEIATRNNRLMSERNLGDGTNKDWYVFTGLSLRYTFGQPPCFCD